MASPIRVVVGRIGRAHGIRGELAVQVRTDEPERRFARGQVLNAGKRSLIVAGSRWHSGRLLVSFDAVSDRTAAEDLQGSLLEVDVDPDEVPVDDGEFYDRQLVGLEARDHLGDVIGSVTSVVHHGEQDTLVVRGDGRDILVPFVSAIVPTIDLAGGFLVVADLPGLLDPESAQ